MTVRLRGEGPKVEELIVAAVHEEVEKVHHSVMTDAPSGGSTDGTRR